MTKSFWIAAGAAIAIVCMSTVALVARSDECGRASWYALPGNSTANGEPMNPNALTAAHRTLPFDTLVRVENLDNGQTLDVRINDRGPFVGGRIIDVSKVAAAKLGFLEDGTTEVCIAQI